MKNYITAPSDPAVCQEDYRFYSYSSLWYDDLIADIAQAKKYILIETYRIGNDEVGKEICEALAAAAKRGVIVRVLADWWGTGLSNSYVNAMTEAGVEVRVFKKLVISPAVFKRNHCRNHRKIVAIDDQISYIGSANMTHYCTQWRESVLRLKGGITKVFEKIFYDNFRIYNKDFSLPWIHKAFKKTIRYKDFYFIRDVPSVFSQRIKKNYLRLIQKAKSSITMETPYFIPGYRIYRELLNALRRGVEVHILIPYHSDVRMVDLMRREILKRLHKAGAFIWLYKQGNLHAKLLTVDKELFSLSSANLDHRSFKYMFEIAIIGEDKATYQLIEEHIEQTKSMCLPLNVEELKDLPLHKKIFTLILKPFRHLL